MKNYLKNKFKKFCILFSLILLSAILELCHAQNIHYSDPVTETYRIRLEESLENRLKKSLTALLQDKNIFVIIKVRLSGEEVPVHITETEDDGFALPGVPMEKNLTEKKEVRITPESKITRKIENIYGWIFVSKEIPKDNLGKVKDLSTEMLGIDLERGDKLTIEAYFKQYSLWDSLQHSNDLVKILTLATFMMASIIFLFGPLAIFLNKLSKSISSSKAQQTMTGISNKILPEIQRAAIKTEVTSKINLENKADFSFITDESIEDLAFILSKGQALAAVIVLKNIPDNLASKVFANLPTDTQKQIISKQKETNFTDTETVKSVREKILEKLNSIYGGPQKVSHLIQGVDKNTRENIVTWLAEDDPTFASKVNNNLIEFSDLLNYDDTSFRRIFRGAGLQAFALALKTSDEKIISDLTSKLNTDVAKLLTEQLKITPSNKKRAEEEQTKILEVIGTLIKNGEIGSISK